MASSTTLPPHSLNLTIVRSADVAVAFQSIVSLHSLG